MCFHGAPFPHAWVKVLRSATGLLTKQEIQLISHSKVKLSHNSQCWWPRTIDEWVSFKDLSTWWGWCWADTVTARLCWHCFIFVRNTFPHDCVMWTRRTQKSVRAVWRCFALISTSSHHLSWQSTGGLIVLVAESPVVFHLTERWVSWWCMVSKQLLFILWTKCSAADTACGFPQESTRHLQNNKR